MAFVAKYWYLFFALALVVGMLIIEPLRGRASGVRRVGIQEAVRLMSRENALVVDVREPNEFQDGHIPRALNMPLSTLDARVAELAKHKSRPIVISCRTSQRSMKAAALLVKQGIVTVTVLDGGITAWQQDHQPVEK